MIRIHEIYYQIDKEQNMQARTKGYKSWEYYTNEYIKNNISPIAELISVDYEDDHILIATWKYKNSDILFKRKAYIMESWME